MSERGWYDEGRGGAIDSGVPDGAAITLLFLSRNREDLRYDWRSRIELRIEERVEDVT